MPLLRLELVNYRFVVLVIIVLTDVCVYRRNLEPQQGVDQLSVEEVVSRDDIHVAFICTDNVLHEENIR